jgi:hypothetical protein
LHRTKAESSVEALSAEAFLRNSSSHPSLLFHKLDSTETTQSLSLVESFNLSINTKAKQSSTDIRTTRSLINIRTIRLETVSSPSSVYEIQTRAENAFQLPTLKTKAQTNH